MVEAGRTSHAGDIGSMLPVSAMTYCLGQDDPATLCADRPLRTREIFKQNDFYGQAAVLKRYAGLPQAYRLKGVLEHGVVLGELMSPEERDARLSTIFSCSTRRAALQERQTRKRTMPIGFGYLYAVRLAEARLAAIPESERKGTLAFPCHSTRAIQAAFDHADYARRLAALPAGLQPVVVCMYWKNHLDGDWRRYAEQGLPIVSAGHIYDDQFLLRFHDLARRFRYACTNKIGTHLFQTIASGCRFFFLPSSDIAWDIPPDRLALLGRINPGYAETEAEAQRLFAAPVDEITPAQREFAERFLGTSDLKSPAELRQILLMAEFCDKCLPLGERGVHGRSEAVPPFLSRPLAKLRRWLGKRTASNSRANAA
jgi:hypothetical protein